MNTANDKCPERGTSQRIAIIAINIFFLLLILTLSCLVDANGTILEMSGPVSKATLVTAFATAFISAITLTTIAEGLARWCGVALMGFYVSMLLPVLLP